MLAELYVCALIDVVEELCNGACEVEKGEMTAMKPESGK